MVTTPVGRDFPHAAFRVVSHVEIAVRIEVRAIGIEARGENRHFAFRRYTQDILRTRTARDINVAVRADGHAISCIREARCGQRRHRFERTVGEADIVDIRFRAAGSRIGDRDNISGV